MWELIGYILQLVTIAITLSLGLVNTYQTKKLQYGKNIISVTTNYRMKRCEQLKESGQKLLSNTVPELFLLNQSNESMLKEAYSATEQIAMIMHRHFYHDRVLIELAAEIANLAVAFHQNQNDEQIRLTLEYKRAVFRIKCDVYTTVDWNRIKSETKGVNTSSESWEDYYSKISGSFDDELNRIKQEYDDATAALQKRP